MKKTNETFENLLVEFVNQLIVLKPLNKQKEIQYLKAILEAINIKIRNSINNYISYIKTKVELYQYTKEDLETLYHHFWDEEISDIYKKTEIFFLLCGWKHEEFGIKARERAIEFLYIFNIVFEGVNKQKTMNEIPPHLIKQLQYAASSFGRWLDKTII